ncbi:aldose 1-epimerase family protein [Naasia sp. SYSU D00948]|uniref:aldose 1-epimerase family protein n=1 Tax=Naasia sp. SYSU D00948 TaxID=2817379 RepID=UPI0027DB8C78|nr:aldose 1-epimerase family protein [Naasia sp. SYSU D00948]
MTPLSGTQFSLASGDYRADIASVGATLRTLRHGERDLVLSFPADSLRPRFLGATLAPWPNRIVNGRYRFADTDQQVAITEPDRGHALHGLASWLDFQATEQAEDSVTLEATVPAQQGYPHRIALSVAYRLGADGLLCETTAVNTGPSAAPYGTAPHPYLSAGPGTADDWTLQLPVSRLLQVDERLSPLDEVDVPGELDFRSPRAIGSTQLDNAFTGIEWADGSAEVRLTAADGRGTALRWGQEYPWVQVFTGDVPEPELKRRGVAVEPMTCPPDAFNSGRDLLVLEPGESFTASWRITAI